MPKKRLILNLFLLKPKYTVSTNRIHFMFIYVHATNISFSEDLELLVYDPFPIKLIKDASSSGATNTKSSKMYANRISQNEHKVDLCSRSGILCKASPQQQQQQHRFSRCFILHQLSVFHSSNCHSSLLQ